jgi:hypothetical protein
MVEIAFFDSLAPSQGPTARFVFSIESLVQTVWPNATIYHGEVGRWLAERGIPASGQASDRSVDGATIAKQATAIRVFRSSNEGVIEFFYVSPRAIHEARAGGPRGLPAAPVGALSMPAAVQIGILSWIAEHNDGWVALLERRVLSTEG